MAISREEKNWPKIKDFPKGLVVKREHITGTI
jgi:hypothetical protein